MGFPKGFLWGGAVAANQCEGALKCGWKCAGERSKHDWFYN